MRFYPFGSSSLNQTYNPALAVTASISDYALSASYGIRVVTASYALAGVSGLTGNPGTCSYQAGPTGPTGSVGRTGAPGSISIALLGSL